MERLKRQAERNREAAKVLRSRGKDAAAARAEARADDLESGRVTDVTDTVIGLYRWAQGR
jgi:RNA polymerase-interacting CarD/CdnL/TRCF family regulator